MLPTNAPGRFLVPQNGALSSNWLAASFDDSSWLQVTSAVGFAVGALDRLPGTGLTNGLMSYWKFDETAGTTAVDATGRGNNGTLVNFPPAGTQWGPGRNDGALRFRGSPANDYIRVANYPKATNALTIAAWVYAEGRPVWASIAKNWSGRGERLLNMIHCDDVANVVIAALKSGRPGEIYNAVDDEPVAQIHFFRWLSETLGKWMPPFSPEEEAASRKRGLTHKKVSNRRIKMELGVQLKYPNFRKGYTAEITRLDRAGELNIAPEPR